MFDQNSVQDIPWSRLAMTQTTFWCSQNGLVPSPIESMRWTLCGCRSNCWRTESSDGRSKVRRQSQTQGANLAQSCVTHRTGSPRSQANTACHHTHHPYRASTSRSLPFGPQQICHQWTIDPSCVHRRVYTSPRWTHRPLCKLPHQAVSGWGSLCLHQVL